MRFQLLGPVQGWVPDRPLSLGQRKQRFLFAVLALEANALVPVSRLVDLMWPDGPPASARAMIHTYVSALRTILANHEAERYGVALVGASGGYELSCDPALVDAHRFRDLVAAARAQDRDEQRVELLTDALGLWRGPALSGVATEPVRARLGGYLDEARLSAVEDRAEALLRLGRHGGLVEELLAVAEDHPYRQRLLAHLVLALHRDGRTTEALRTFDRVRRRLADELGIDPGADLGAVHQAILQGKSGPAPRPVAPPRPAGMVTCPAQLPADLAIFVGRAAELDHVLTRLPDDERAVPAALVISSIEGMAGIGKTALAVRAAHRMAHRFPDGQVFLDLHGFTPGVAPVAPDDALERMLLALGLPGERIPSGVDDRAAALRTVLNGRRVLVLLDNAAGEEQVRPLLPGTPGCLVMITSRRRLTGLDDAWPVPLDALPTGDALALFTRISGRDRPEAQLREVVEVCGGLPLAIRIAAARLRSRPKWTIVDLAERLRDRRHRLAELSAGQRSVGAAVDVSYRHLTGEQRRLFRLAGQHPGPDLDVAGAAALTGGTVQDAGLLLDQLLDASLVEEPAPGRYRFHDLVRAHAAATAEAEEPEPQRRAALTRLFDYYAHTASRAVDLLFPFDAGRRRAAPDWPGAPQVCDSARAEAWLSTELANLLAVAGHDSPTHTMSLSGTLRRWLRTRAMFTDAVTLHTQAVRAAQGSADRDGEADALASLADVHHIVGDLEAADCFEQARSLAAATGYRRGELTALQGIASMCATAGRYEEAFATRERALAIARELGDRVGEGEALWGMGDLHRLGARYQSALECYERALALAREVGHRRGELNALGGVASLYGKDGRSDEEVDCYRQALAIAQEIGDRMGEINAVGSLGNVDRRAGRYRAAAGHYQRVLDLSREIGNRIGELHSLRGLGDIHRVLGETEPAATCFQQALELSCELGHRNGEFEAVLGLGLTACDAGSPEQAVGYLQGALNLARELGQPDDEVRARDGLATALRDLGRHPDAREHWRCALDLLNDLELEHVEDVSAAEIRSRLAGLS